ncbi:hypothetical protein PRZ48_013047 [Zasmidium cellare]|uniref:CFEM domain-containing protein n=1 Tax=Zasmidium cellare TaxID=395010 RepID=A0ABR0E370_ZASCE|nr:hypothetical protein PRZ48_013047 [Zasmidium cellare]
MVSLKASTLALTLAALATAVPQGLPAGIADLPDCALNGLPAVLAASGCPGIDVDCLCSKPDLPAQLETAVQTACTDEADRKKIIDFVAGFCPTSAPASTSTPPASTTDAPVTGAVAPAPTTSAPTTTTETSTAWPSASSSWINYTNGTNGTSTPTYNSPQPSDTGAPVSEGGAASISYSLFAFVVAMGGMTWAFAEL